MEKCIVCQCLLNKTKPKAVDKIALLSAGTSQRYEIVLILFFF